MNSKVRVRSMLKLDFYRLFHTPLFYIMLVISAIIPAMVLSLAGMDMSPPESNSPHTANVQQVEMVNFENTWQMIESTKDEVEGFVVPESNDAVDFAGFMNINMLFIFVGLLVAIFVAHDYSSGFIKNIFTVHSKKIDYVISKTAIGLFSGAGMVLTYVFGAVLAGLLTGKSFALGAAGAGGLILCLLSKMLLMGVFCSGFLSIAVFFKNRLWLTIVFTFMLGMMLYPAASVATLDSTALTTLISLLAGCLGAVVFGLISEVFLKKRDLA